MKRLIFLIVAVLVLASMLLACSKATAPAPPVTAGVPAPAPAMRAPSSGGVPSVSGESSATLPSQSPDRMIVRNGDMSLVVKDVLQSRDDIAQLTSRLEGYVVSSSISGRDNELRGSIAIRVPDSKFDQALAELRKLAVRVTSERTSSQDITQEYVDLTARLKNAEATEAQYLVLLGKADKVEDILRIYEKLSQVRQEIEQIKGRMQYLERQSAMSLINVNLEPETSSKPIVSTGWNFIETVKSAARGFVVVGKVLLTVLVWLAIFIPIWGTVAGIIYWRRRKKKASS